MIEKVNKYSAPFTAGALLFKEADVYIANIQNGEQYMKDQEEVDMQVLPINAESSKKRIKRELDNRLRSLKDARLIDYYLGSEEKDKKLILFYAACKSYPLLMDFMIEVVLNKWYNLDLDIDSDDYQNFIYRKMDSHPELLKIAESTRHKSGQVTLRMLKELGMIKNNKLTKEYFDPKVLRRIALNDDQWFLELLFINEAEKKELLKA